MKTQNIILICFLTLLPTLCGAQEVVDNDGDRYCFNHLTIGGSIGTTGIGVELATPVNRHLTLRAGLDVIAIGTVKLKLMNSMGDMYSIMGVNNKYIDEAVQKKKVEVGGNATQISGRILLDYYPWKSTGFHVTGGVTFGNRNVLHVFNTEEGNMMFSTISNYYVKEYNKYFQTAYPEVGLKFGDYIFTADENGNVDAKMLTNVVRPYVGIGWGRSIDIYHKRKIRTNFDLGFDIWGRPQFNLNNGEKLVKTGNNSENGALKFVSGFWAWPVMKITLCGDLF